MKEKKNCSEVERCALVLCGASKLGFVSKIGKVGEMSGGKKIGSWRSSVAKRLNCDVDDARQAFYNLRSSLTGDAPWHAASTALAREHLAAPTNGGAEARRDAPG